MYHLLGDTPKGREGLGRSILKFSLIISSVGLDLLHLRLPVPGETTSLAESNNEGLETLARTHVIEQEHAGWGMRRAIHKRAQLQEIKSVFGW